MQILRTILTILFVIDCIALTVVVLMQEGKSQGLGAIAGAADTYWGKNKGRSMEGGLVKATTIMGVLFFVLAGFAALTSCISVLESITANCMELFHTERKKTTRVLSVIYLIATAVIALGYSIFYVEVALPNGSTGQLLDIMDYISNSFMMPFISLLSAILIGWIMKPSWIAEEMELNGEKFKRKKLYNVMMRYIMPVIMVILFLQSTGVLNMIMK